jgi:hypothetical protein
MVDKCSFILRKYSSKQSAVEISTGALNELS